MTKRQYVYFLKPVGLDGPVKIGCSHVPQERLTVFSQWSPWPLEIVAMVPGTAKDEGYLHRSFADLHSHGEWFRSSRALWAVIDAIREGGDISVARGMVAPLGSIRSNPTRGRSAEAKRRMAYRMRLYWAERRLRKQVGDDGAWYPPSDVTSIVDRWSGYGKQDVSPPSDAELRRLDEYIADPAPHAVLPPWIRRAA